MIPLKFAYLVGTLTTLIPLVFICIIRKDLRPGIIKAALILIPCGLFCEYFFWTKDWWHPATITNTKLGIEDVLLSASNGGFVFALYFTFFRNQKIISKNVNIKKSSFILILNLFLLSFLFWGIKLSSFYATTTCFLLTCTILFYKKPTVIIPSLFTGAVMVFSYIPVYLILITTVPELIIRIWYMQNLSGVLFLGIPIEDIVFYSVGGIYASAVLFYPNVQVKTASRQ